MKLMVYVGVPKSLGRFGQVEPNQVLPMTEYEARTVALNMDFEPYSKTKHKKANLESHQRHGTTEVIRVLEVQQQSYESLKTSAVRMGIRVDPRVSHSDLARYVLAVIARNLKEQATP
jgi:hypothetical protein